MCGDFWWHKPGAEGVRHPPGQNPSKDFANFFEKIWVARVAGGATLVEPVEKMVGRDGLEPPTFSV
jgi:hypothetical protein